MLFKFKWPTLTVTDLFGYQQIKQGNYSNAKYANTAYLIHSKKAWDLHLSTDKKNKGTNSIWYVSACVQSSQKKTVAVYFWCKIINQ